MSIKADLAPRLSEKASLSVPGDAEFQKLLARWREWQRPRLASIVKAATGTDVQDTVRYANEQGIPFVARSGGHGATEALAEADAAIQIDFRDMNNVQIAADGRTATIGAGANNKQIIAALMKEGKQTVTGICEAVGYSAVVLGGGHGWLQGQYGLAADQMVSARVVLPNGDAVTVSDESHPDLFWALRGAGHNFGLVTEWQCRIYDIKNTTWSYEIFVFSGDKLEALFELTNEMMRDQPPEVTHWTYVIRVAEINPDHPIIWCVIVYDGPVSKAREYAKPIHDIGPLMVDAGETDIPGLAAKSFQSEDGPGCAYGLTSFRFPIGLKSYNVSALRKVYNDIDETFRKVSELAGSFFLLEGYSTQGVKKIDPKSTAFPHRDDEVLVTPYIQHKPDPRIVPAAQESGARLRKHLLEGSDDPEHLHAYVNYAHGTESLGEVYGWEGWRQEKLKRVKAE